MYIDNLTNKLPSLFRNLDCTDTWQMLLSLKCLSVVAYIILLHVIIDLSELLSAAL